MNAPFYRYDPVTVDNLKKHRTVRAFHPEAVPDPLLEDLRAAVNQSATSSGLQQFSVIRMLSAKGRAALAELAGQAYLASAAELWIFLVDCRRNQDIARLQQTDFAAGDTMDAFFQGYADALIAAQTLTAGAEALGLGTVYFGSILNDAARVVEILELPPLTFPVVGVGFGYAAEEPALKPRLPLAAKFFTDRYERGVDEEALVRYDQELSQYYDLREPDQPVGAFSQLVMARLGSDNPRRQRLLEVVRAQGFRLFP